MLQLLNAYLNFDGRCAEAMRFYQRVFGGQLDMLSYAQAPAQDGACAPADPNRIMHASLRFEGQTLMAADHGAPTPYEGLKGFGLTLSYDTVDEARKVFEQLGEGGQVQMPLAETFWAEGFGCVVDKFGVPWLVNGAMKPM